MKQTKALFLFLATNRADVLDPALLRPGRFDRRVYVPKPDVRGRKGILDVHTRKTPLAKDVDIDIIAQGTSGFSGADLENLAKQKHLLLLLDPMETEVAVNCTLKKLKIK